MEPIPLPNLKLIKDDNRIGIFEISPLYPGYGQTIANALRRVLLSSLPGTAADSIKIEGINHEFTSIEGIKEDVVEILLNVKSLRVKQHGETENTTLTLEKNTPGDVTAADFEKNSDIEILDPEFKLATLDQGGKLSMQVHFVKGRGYIASESKERDKEIGLIVLDSFFSPVKHVEFKVEDTRVGHLTNFDKITLTVETDGSIEPKTALIESSRLLTEHYALITNINTALELDRIKIALEDKIIETKNEIQNTNITENNFHPDIVPPLDSKTKIEDIDLSGRTKNALLAAGYKTLSGLKRLSEIKLAGIKGLGAKGLEEVSDLLKRVED